VILTALTTWAAVQSLSRLGAPSSATQSVAGENRLFRAERRPQNTNIGYARPEAGRILLTSAGHAGVTADDRNFKYCFQRTASQRRCNRGELPR
jgi:hypothetical protein